MSTISIERLVSSYNNESMELDSTYEELKDLVCDTNNESFKKCFSSIKDNYILNGDISQLLPSSERSKGVTYEDALSNESVETNKTKIKEEFIKKYVKQNYILGLLFGNIFRKIAGERRNTLFLFPSYNNGSRGSEKLNVKIEKYYRWLFKLNDFERFYFSNVDSEDGKATPPYKYLKSSLNPKEGFPNNSIAFIPVFTDTPSSESPDEFKTRIQAVFDDISNRIIKEAKYGEGQVVISGKEKMPFTSICYMIDNENDKNMFTGYYNDTLASDKAKVLNSILNDFIQRKSIDIQNIRLSVVTPDPIKKFNKDFVSKDLSSIATRIKMSTSSTFYNEMISKLNLFIEKINDTYKKTTDKAYAKIATSQSNISFMRLYYRVNNIDKDEDSNIIKTGNDFLYCLTGVVINPEDKNDKCNKVYICKMYELPGREGRYRVEVHKNETKDFRKSNKSLCNSDDAVDIIEKADEVEIGEYQTDNQTKYFQATIEVKKIFGIYRFRLFENNQSYSYPGTLVFFRDLHTNERYKWFKHNDINGSLSQDTQIKFYNNILFDKKSLIEYLKSKKMYDEAKTSLGYEFLKINEDINQLIQYSDFIYNNENLRKTHINEPNILLRSLPFNQNVFLEKIKESILDIIFQPNQIIYIGGAKKSVGEKEDTSKNYKVIGYSYYKTDLNTTYKTNLKKAKKMYNNKDKNEMFTSVNDFTPNEIIKTLYPLAYSHLNNISHGDENEVRYCPHRKLNKCEVIREPLKDAEERMIAVVDITRDVHDASSLKERARCKRLRKSIKLRMKRLTQPLRLDKVLIGRIIGGKKSMKTKKKTYKKLH
jgi:hypothetical protein